MPKRRPQTLLDLDYPGMRHTRLLISPLIRNGLTAFLIICLPLEIPIINSTSVGYAATDSESPSSHPSGTDNQENFQNVSGSAHDEQLSGSSEDGQRGELQISDDKVQESTQVPSSETLPEDVSPQDREKDSEREPEQPIDQKKQEKEEQKPETIVDVLHAGISRSIQGTATWMDSFFGDRRYLSELNQSYIRFRYNVFLEDRSRLYLKPDLQFRMVLPQLREKTHLVFSGAPPEAPEFSAVQSNSESDQISTGEERNLSASVHRTVRETARDSIIMRAGLRLHQGKPGVMLGPRYRILFPLDSWNLRFVEEVVWRSNIGWEAKSTADLERPLPIGLFFRATNEWIWREHVNGYVYAFIFYLGQPINHRRGLEYEWINVFQTKPINELIEVTLRVRYRQQFWRDWLYFEIDPQCRFPRDRSFNATPGILFRLEMILGNYR